MECCSGGELFEKEITVSENNLAILAKKVLTAINYCHKKNIVKIHFIFFNNNN